jgi:hypothetical protein
MQDFIAWHLTKAGLFTMRLVYHKEWDYHLGRHNPEDMSIGRYIDSHVQKKLWGLNIPSKIK